MGKISILVYWQVKNLKFKMFVIKSSFLPLLLNGKYNLLFWVRIGETPTWGWHRKFFQTDSSIWGQSQQEMWWVELLAHSTWWIHALCATIHAGPTLHQTETSLYCDALSIFIRIDNVVPHPIDAFGFLGVDILLEWVTQVWLLNAVESSSHWYIRLLCINLCSKA